MWPDRELLGKDLVPSTVHATSSKHHANPFDVPADTGMDAWLPEETDATPYLEVYV